MGTERRLPVSDAEVLAAYRGGESQRALAQRFKVSKGAVQKAIARAEGRCPRPSPEPSAPPGSTGAPGSRPMLDIRERLEHEALNSKDGRSRVAALRELRSLRQDAGLCPNCANLSTAEPSPVLRDGSRIFPPGTPLEEEFAITVRDLGDGGHAYVYPVQDEPTEAEKAMTVQYGPGNIWPPPWGIRGFERWPLTVPYVVEYDGPDGTPSDEQIRQWGRPE